MGRKKKIFTLDDGDSGTAEDLQARRAPGLRLSTLHSRLQRSTDPSFVFASVAANKRKTGWHTHASLNLPGSPKRRGQ